MADQPKTADDVKAFVEERDIRFIRLWFTDILGQLKSFSINAEELDDAFEGGMGFDGSSITGFNAIEESDMIAMPDAVDLRGAALAARGPRRARMFCDVVTPSREPYEGDPRHVLRRALERAEGMGFDELLRRPGARVLLLPQRQARERRSPRSSTRAATSTSRRSTRAPTCAARRCSRSSSSASTWSTPTTRSGPSQHEIDMRYADALKMADDCMTYRITVKEYAMKYGWHATFMPKPLFGENGSGMHTHQSLFHGRRATPSTTPTTSTSCPTSARRSSPASSSTPARSPRSSPSGSTPTSGWCPATRRRSTAPGRDATARRSCGCRSTTPARSRRRAWSCAVPTRRATPT